MKKRVVRSATRSSPDSKRKKSFEALDDIHNKIVNSSALNGGFETLLYKIDKIEQSQGQLVSKVDKIHDAIYDPNDGIFSKLSEHKLENNDKINEISQDIVELHSWKKHVEKEEIKDDETVVQAVKKLTELETSVDGLVKSKKDVWSVAKWFLAAVGGGIITLFFKWFETKLR